MRLTPIQIFCLLIILVFVNMPTYVNSTDNNYNVTNTRNSKSCIFPFTFLFDLMEAQLTDNSQILPINLFFKETGEYTLSGEIENWVKAGDNLWKSQSPFTIKCLYVNHDMNENFFDDDEMGVVDNDVVEQLITLNQFLFDDVNHQYQINIGPHDFFPEGTFNLFIYFKTKICPGLLSFSFSKTIYKKHESVPLRSSAFTLDDKPLEEFVFNADILENKSNNSIDLYVDFEEKNKQTDKLSLKKITKRLLPCGILFCKNKNDKFWGEIQQNDWIEIKEKIWQGKLYIFKRSGKITKNSFHFQPKDTFGPDRFQVDLCQPKQSGLPLLVQILSDNKPGTLQFKSPNHLNLPKKTVFVSLTDLKNYFRIDGQKPLLITPDKSLLNHTQHPLICIKLKDRTRKINRPVQKKGSNELIPSGIFFPEKGNYSITAKINKHEWTNIDKTLWQAKLINFNSKAIQIKGFHHTNGRFEINAKKDIQGGKPLFINVISAKKPGNLNFRFNKNIHKEKYFIPFVDMTSCFNMDGKRTSLINEDPSINNSPSLSLFFKR